MLKRLRVKFVCITMLIVTAMLCVIMGLTVHFTQENLENESIQLMRTAATGLGQPDIPDAPAMQGVFPYCTIRLGRGGEIIDISGNYDLSDSAELERLMQTALDSEEDIGIIKAYSLRYLRIHAPNGYTLVFADTSMERNMMGSLLKNCLLIGLASLAVLLLVSIALAGWAIRPVEMAWDQQRQFVADASHELKTPLTVISTNAELLSSQDCTAEETGRFSQNILVMAQQMRGLIEGMLELARIDNGAVRTTFSSVDLSGLVNDAVLPFDAVFFERGLYLDCQVENGISVMGSQSHLRQLVEIFLDNAQKYSHLETTVAVSLRTVGRTHCLLTVSNCGDEISKEDLGNIFKRFYRVDKVRTMSSSYGLGLSIAEGIVSDHRGEIWAESSSGVNTFSVRLPMLSQQA